MHNANIPNDRELPSTGKLIKSTIIAAVTAGVLLVTVVMPAEYGIDPTGIGRAIGLKQMGEIKMSLAEEAELEQTTAQETVRAMATAKPLAQAEMQEVVPSVPEPAAPAASASDRASQPAELSHEMSLSLSPNEGAEIKVELKKGMTTKYVWFTDGGKANFDIHGDSKESNIDYHGYSKGAKERDEGVLVAAFDGYHGWFWRNRTKKPLTVTLQTRGDYTDIKRLK
ncbi:MAG: transmembrane anchor protein [Alphaproteobacteria bacterium]